MSTQFAAWELHMYLDTHPYDREMFLVMRKHLEEAEQLKREFESKFGPLTHDAVNEISDSWTQNPWPWEYQPGTDPAFMPATYVDTPPEKENL